MQFSNVTVTAKGNLYFDGNVVSHSVTMEDGSKKTLGIVAKPGSYHFATQAAERMDISDGACKVTLDGSEVAKQVSAGSHFDVPANSGFTIEVDSVCQYVCSYLA
ncbi:pyrimidine/purine nucleoside phosphorylase [Pelagicoccus sp. SDUM812003]|uniref:pyrimidine/purine nucleoside phosphorylase n=1 Tax=Pelagicoccus sp. SDUM812003 TaxID=3041267 RepID=UPI00280CCC3B|nr:pyrimidine/purine nucleoside phosphorylase [Pelagicoccus sp. SDUM812003]MDQ8202354.1 pyrimidine/purine nucleoside phosphorylase [Pelagicoccus sp. SDUM812003]